MPDTAITQKLSLAHPIVQGPFGGGLSSVELAAVVSNEGGLGSFGCQPYSADEIIRYAGEIRAKTNKPFNLNLWVNDRDERLGRFGQADYEKCKEIFKPYFHELAIPFPEMSVDLGPSYEDQVPAILETKPAVFSFVFGIPSAEILAACRKNGIFTLGTATTVEEAVAIEAAGVDAVVATGFEAGGHRVSFLKPAEDSLNGTLSLVRQVVEAVSIPVIAAGGIADARGIRAALTLGAQAAQIGTAFLATAESNATPEHKEKLFSADARHTTLTKIITGRLGRAIQSKLTEELKAKEHLLAPYPMQRKFTNALTAGLLANRKTDYTTFWAGQSAGLLRHKTAAGLFRALVKELAEV